MTGSVGYLRVYQPVDAFPEPDRGLWASYLAAGRALERGEALRLERAATVAALIGPAARLPAAVMDEQALVVDGPHEQMLCPLWTRLRARIELLEQDAGEEPFANGYPLWVSEAARAEEQAFRRAHPRTRPSILSCVGQLPLSWFALFEPAEAYRRPAEASGQPPLDTGRVLLYRTSMVRARQRTARALHVLRGRAAAPLRGALEDLGRWLEEFHPHGIVELDYGDFADEVGDVAAEDSVALVRSALRALREGRAERARFAYERVSGRWRERAIRQTSN